jgi:hypothetical protein
MQNSSIAQHLNIMVFYVEHRKKPVPLSFFEQGTMLLVENMVIDHIMKQDAD